MPTSPHTSTSSRPSSGSACGQTLMPPPKARPLAQMTLLATSSSGGSSSTCDAERDVAPGRERRHGRVQERGRAAEPLRRALGALGDGAGQAARADVDVPARALAAAGRAERRAAEVDRARAPAAQQLERAARRASGCRRCGSCRARCRTAGSPARGRRRRSAARPLTTSLTVPSPPSAATSSRPSAAAARASSVACPGASVKTGSSSRPSSRARSARRGQRVPGGAVLRRRVDDHVRARRQLLAFESAARIASSVMLSTAALSSVVA